MKTQLDWSSNSKELGSFFQMIGKNESSKIQYFITKMKNEPKYTLKILDGKIPTYFFDTIKEAQEFSQEHFNLKNNGSL